jgi:hypothetical protein
LRERPNRNGSIWAVSLFQERKANKENKENKEKEDLPVCVDHRASKDRQDRKASKVIKETLATKVIKETPDPLVSPPSL